MEDKPTFKIHYDGNGCTLICTWRANKEPKIDIKKLQSVATQTQTMHQSDEPCPSEEDTEKSSLSKIDESSKEESCEIGEYNNLAYNIICSINYLKFLRTKRTRNCAEYNYASDYFTKLIKCKWDSIIVNKSPQ